MKIRSITYFENLQWPLDVDRVQQASKFISRARKSFQDGGFEVQTTRLATPPFPLIVNGELRLETRKFAAELESRLISNGFEYVSIGPALPEYPESYSVLPEVLANSQNIFVAGVMSSSQGGIFPSAINSAIVIALLSESSS